MLYSVSLHCAGTANVSRAKVQGVITLPLESSPLRS